MITLHHLAFRVGDLDAMAAFYREWFGLPLVRDLSPRALWLGLGAHAVLMLERRTQAEPTVDGRTQELVAFGIAIPERLALRARLLARGMLEAETEHTLYFRDPEGRRVAASSYPLGTSS